MAQYPNRVQVNLSDKLRDRVSLKAEEMGVSIPEYVRYVILRNLEDEIDESLLKDIEKSEKEYSKGEVIRTSSTKEALDVLKSLHND